MSVSITHLGSGSRGNSTLISSENGNVLIDNGFSGRQLEKRLARMELKPTDIDCMLISHHHGDHGGGVEYAMRKWDIPAKMNYFTAEKLGVLDKSNLELFESLDRLEILSDVTFLPFPVPHSGAENVGFSIVTKGGEKTCVVTDLGSETDEVIKHMQGCSHISIESNYDLRRLLSGPYPDKLKNRIMGRGGHLSNKQTGKLLSKIIGPKTKSIVLTHLSEKNNQPHLAESTVLYHIDDIFTGDIAISLQDGPEFSHFLGQSEHEKMSIKI
ncbi:MAG: MBL fold metallo-hydrolase [Candidatus Thermoplasmatota archaeon]|nr:MBL fold metallo-hydrolase [Candidatus Thermoplasmatota archaeon]